MGLRSGLYAGRYKSRQPAAAMACSTPWTLWEGRLSMTTAIHWFCRARAAVFTAMALGVPLLHAQLSRVLGVDTLSPEGDRQVAVALLDIYSHAQLSPELAASARAGLDRAP